MQVPEQNEIQEGETRIIQPSPFCPPPKVKKGDIVLIDYEQDNQADVIHLYTAEEVVKLKEFKHIPENGTYVFWDMI